MPNVPNSSRERETAKRELETAKNELEIAKQELETVKNERETVKSELEAVKSEVKTAKSEVKTAKSEVETAKLDDFPEFEPLYALATSSAQDPAGIYKVSQPPTRPPSPSGEEGNGFLQNFFTIMNLKSIQRRQRRY